MFSTTIYFSNIHNLNVSVEHLRSRPPVKSQPQPVPQQFLLHLPPGPAGLPWHSTQLPKGEASPASPPCCCLFPHKLPEGHLHLLHALHRYPSLTSQNKVPDSPHPKEVKIHSSQKTVKVEDKINSKFKSFLYVLESTKTPRGPGSPPSQYVGQSGQTVSRRLGAHVKSMKTRVRWWASTSWKRQAWWSTSSSPQYWWWSQIIPGSACILKEGSWMTMVVSTSF